MGAAGGEIGEEGGVVFLEGGEGGDVFATGGRARCGSCGSGDYIGSGRVGGGVEERCAYGLYLQGRNGLRL